MVIGLLLLLLAELLWLIRGALAGAVVAIRVEMVRVDTGLGLICLLVFAIFKVLYMHCNFDTTPYCLATCVMYWLCCAHFFFINYSTFLLVFLYKWHKLP